MLIRAAAQSDFGAIGNVLEKAFGRADEAALVTRLREENAIVLELVVETGGHIAGHVLFSRLQVSQGANAFAAVALAPLSVMPEHQRAGIGSRLVEEGHLRLQAAGERLSVVLGDPGYYGRFGYAHARAAGFASDYQCDALQALAWGEAPATGRLAYPAAFSAL
jgi:putative acetyltransferase